MDEEQIKALAQYAHLVRFSLNAGTKETFKVITGRDNFDLIITHAKQLITERAKAYRENELYVGANYIVAPDNYRDMYAASQLCKDLGLDFLLFRYLNPIKQRFFGADLDSLKFEMDRSIALADDKYMVKCPFEKVAGIAEKKLPHERCFSSNFRLYVDSHGDVYPCFSAAQWKKSCWGNIYSQSMTDIINDQANLRCKEKLQTGHLNSYCYDFCPKVEFNAFVDWAKKSINYDPSVKFKKKPRSAQDEIIDKWF